MERLDNDVLNNAINATEAFGGFDNAYEQVKYEFLKELRRYRDTGLTPEQIREIDKLYAEKCRELAEVKQQAIAQCFMSIRYENPGMENDWCAGLRTVDGEGEPCEVCKRCYMHHEHHRAELGILRRSKVWSD